MPNPTLAHLMLLHAETPMHPGAGSALGMVDLPVARERHTQFPYIAGSSLKGVLRDACSPAPDGAARQQWLTTFGPETNEAHAYAGALAITDARLLALPLRSLSGLFAWATCPAILHRLVRDTGLANAQSDVATRARELSAVANLRDGAVLVAPNSPLLIGNNAVILEEFDYAATTNAAVAELGRALATLLGDTAALRLATHLAVIDDNSFGFAARHATEVVARVGLDSETKTVKTGALFYEEFLPAGTLFYALAMADPPRSPDDKRGGLANAAGVLDYLNAGLQARGGVLQIGGNASIGKGITTVVLAGGAQ